MSENNQTITITINAERPVKSISIEFVDDPQPFDFGDAPEVDDIYDDAIPIKKTIQKPPTDAATVMF